MSTKQELAALMASDSDHEKKISLLKRAVVTVTKQKQEVESRQTQLQDELRSTAQQLIDAQRENTLLQRKIKSLETQLGEAQNAGSSAFGHNVFKGLSSIMGSSDAASRGRGGGGRGGTSVTSPLALAPEDVERIVTENELLHREKYACKTQLEEVRRNSTAESDGLKGEVARLRLELEGMQKSLDTASATCDRLNAASVMQTALADFCRHFFFVTIWRGAAQASIQLQWPAHPSTSVSKVENELSHAAQEQMLFMLQSACTTVKTLLRSLSVLIVVLREQLPRRERATVGDLESLRDRLTVLLDAHTVKKDRLMYLLDEMEASLANLHLLDASASNVGDCNEGRPLPNVSSCADSAATVEDFVEAQAEVVQLFQDWIALVRAQLPLLVESCVSFLPQGHPYTLRVGNRRASSSNGATTAATAEALMVVDRAQFVEEVTRHGYAALVAVEGSLTAVHLLVQCSPAAYRGPEALQTPEGKGTNRLTPHDLGALLALQQFWWEGCAAVRSLAGSALMLEAGVADVAEACNRSEARDALHHLGKCLRALSSPAVPAMSLVHTLPDTANAAAEAMARDADAALQSLQLSFNRRARPITAASVRASSPDPLASPVSTATLEGYEELLMALAAADRAAVSYHTQMNQLYLEMADKEDALHTAVAAAQEMANMLTAERAEAEHTQRRMQEQLSLLSTQLIETATTVARPPS